MLLAAPSALLALGGLFYGLTRGFTQQCWFWGCHQLEYWDFSPPGREGPVPPGGLGAGLGVGRRGPEPWGFRSLLALFSCEARRDDLNNLIPGCDQAWRKGKGNKEAPSPEQQ